MIIERLDVDPYICSNKPRNLGEGSYGLVKPVHNNPAVSTSNSAETFARKEFRNSKNWGDRYKELEKEFKIMQKIECLNGDEKKFHMLRLVRAYTHDDNVYLVTKPVADGGKLFDYLRDDPGGDTLKRFMGCLLVGLDIMRDEAKVRHHDIHPGNILVHQHTPLYIDFGFGYDFEHADDSKTHGKELFHDRYAAPEFNEILFGTTTWNIIPNWFYQAKGTKSEVFALGAVFFEMIAIATDDKKMNDFRLTKGKRYGSRDHAEALAALQDLKRKLLNKRAGAPGPETKQTLFHCLCLTESMLQRDPEQRPSAFDAAYILCGESNPDHIRIKDISDVPMCEHCKIWLGQKITITHQRLWNEYIGYQFSSYWDTVSTPLIQG